jgi:hypothetical protein
MTSVLAGPARLALLVLQAVVALTAAGGGTALVAGALVSTTSGAITPSDAYLDGSPFTGYLLPGVLLLVVIGGFHAAAFVAGLRRSPWAPLAAAAAAIALLTWIFVQMIWIPFSPLQAVYEVVAMVELGLVLVQLGVLDVVASRRHRIPTPLPAPTGQAKMLR